MQCRNLAVKLIEKAKESGFNSAGKDPKGIAAAAIYIATKISNENRTQKEISNLAKVTEVTLRMRVKDLQKYANIVE
jgi:transcription initiation factor TFIIB